MIFVHACCGVTHPTIDALRGPEAKQKDELIAKFRPVVEQKGDVANGKKLFTANCAVCHSFKGEGRGLAPDPYPPASRDRAARRPSGRW